jgi:hypothetical protein
MKRAAILVVAKNGISYDANHLSIYMDHDFSEFESGAFSVLTFQCSGRLMTLRADEVERIEWNEASAQWCSECDGSLHNIIGVGCHK